MTFSLKKQNRNTKSLFPQQKSGIQYVLYCIRFQGLYRGRLPYFNTRPSAEYSMASALFPGVSGIPGKRPPSGLWEQPDI